MIDYLHHRGWHYVLLLSIGSLVFFLNLGGPTLWDVDEGRNTTCAMEMMASGNWIIPTFNGQLRVDKPALLYWLQIFSYQAFGINEFAARLPSALAALLTVLLSYELARSMFTRTTGLLAGVIVASMPMLCGAARFANPDALLNLFTVLTLTLWWIGLAERRWWWFVALGASSGLAVLAKGPVGLVLPGAIATLFLLWQRDGGVVWDRRWQLAFWTFALVALPWYIWVGVETKGAFLRGFLLKHNLERGFSAMENHSGFPGYYLVVLLVGTAPWSIFLGAAWWFGFWSAIRTPWQRCQHWWTFAAETQTPAAYRLLACWIAVYVLFFSIAATKLPNYVLPVVVPSAILIARFLQRWRTETLVVHPWIVRSGIICLMLTGVLFTTGMIVAGGAWEWPILRGRHIPGLEQWAFLGVIPMLAAAAGTWFVHAKQPTRFLYALSAAAVLMLVPFAAFGSAVFNGGKAAQPLVFQADASRAHDDLRIGCWQVGHLPSLNFYAQRNVEQLNSENDVVEFLLARIPVYLFIPAREFERLQPSFPGGVQVVGRHYDFYRHNEIVVISNCGPSRARQ
jgi:4-amino-4-deoxy-L-arabinose transferase-like glycosyltransferase